MRLLLVAPTIDKTDVGESWVAYQWAERLSRRHDVTILTYRKRNAVSAASQVPLARVIEWSEPPFFGRFERFNSLFKPFYFVFFWKARRWIADAHARGDHFDLAHQVVPVAMRYPVPMVGSTLSYVIGPVGGSLPTPPAFSGELSDPWYQRLRGMDRWRLRHDRWLRSSYEGAACVVGIAGYVSEALRDLEIRRMEVMSEVALTELPDVVPREHVTATPDRPLRLLFVGRVIRSKGARDLIAAMALLRDAPVVADIVGDGFDMAACRELVAGEDLGQSVRFHGRRSRAEVDRFYERADVFVFPSHREPGGGVIFEAMGHGLPLLVCDRGGPSAAVDPDCAIRIPARSPSQLAEELAQAIRLLAADPERRLQMGAAARRRVAEVGLWDPKIERMGEIYASILSDGHTGCALPPA